MVSRPTKPLEVSRAIANFENLRKTLYDAYYRRMPDVAIAEGLTQAAFGRFKLAKLLSSCWWLHYLAVGEVERKTARKKQNAGDLGPPADT